MKSKKLTLVVAALLSVAFTINLHAQTSAFMYQGRLLDNGNPASGIYDLRFTIYDSTNRPGTLVAGPITNSAVAVTNGLFTTTLDFGSGVFDGSDRWLEIGVATNGTATFATLAPRQELTPTPYAITAGNLVSGGLPATYSSAVNFNSGGNSFTGSGAGLTSLNASSLAGGTVPDARLSANVARTSQVWLLGGNSVAAGQFLGSTNHQSVELWAGGQRALLLKPDDADEGAPNLIGGSSVNSVSNGVVGATIGGGGATIYDGLPRINRVTADFGTVGGGYNNAADGTNATVSGGAVNTASGNYATAGGGTLNRASGDDSVVDGGFDNTANGGDATVGGGGYNSAGSHATVGGGFRNYATGYYATVPGGINNTASGTYSFAAGNSAQATNDGAFVWADSQYPTFGSERSDTFNIRAQNGVHIQSDTGIHLNAADRPLIVRDWDVFATNAPAYKAGIGRWGLFMETDYLTLGIPSLGGRYFQVAKYNTNGTYATLLSVDQAGNLRATGNVYANGVELTSDRNAKENFTALNAKTVLAKVLSLPVMEWNYRTDPAEQKHIGPMAQDFHAAFGVNGRDDKHISVIDEGGVALAAIQGLNQKMEKENAALRAENAELKAQLGKIEALLTQRLNGEAK